jgi:hypothetical protein
MYLDAEHAAVRTDGLLALFAVVLHFDLVLLAFLFCPLVRVHCAHQVFYLVDETFAVCKTGQWQHLPAVGTLRAGVLDPLAQTAFAGQLGAGWTHAGFLDSVEANVALEERGVVGTI